MKKILGWLLLFVALGNANAAILTYNGTGEITGISSAVVPVDIQQSLSFSLSLDDSSINISTDVGRGEFSTSSQFTASVGGINFHNDGMATIITNDSEVAAGIGRSWVYGTDIVTDGNQTGWFQIALIAGPNEVGLSIVPLNVIQYSLPYFFTAFGNESDWVNTKTNFYGALSSLNQVPEPTPLALIGLGLVGLGVRRIRKI
jgi:hypothetical protein